MSARRGAGGRRRYEPDWPSGSPGGRRSAGRLMLVIGATILVVGLGGSLLFDGPGDADGGSEDASPTTAASTASPTATPTPPREYPAAWYRSDTQSLDFVPVHVNAVIDGDTLDVEAAGTALRVRAYGFDTPEMGERCYDEARDRLDELVGDRVLLLADERLEDPSGRQLRYLYTPDGLLIDAVMVSEGYAEAWRSDGSLRDFLRALERAARDANVGCLWSQ